MIEIPAESHYTVYKLTAPNGLIYIGCTGLEPRVRWCKGYQKGVPIRNAIDEFGLEAFKKEILCEKLTRAGASKLEKWFIAYYDSTDPEKGYNRMLGGMDKGQKMCNATKEKLRNLVLAHHAEDQSFKQSVQGIQEPDFQVSAPHDVNIENIEGPSIHPQKCVYGKPFNKPIPVRCVETGKIYPSQKEAERETGFLSIHKVCIGLRETCGGYHWAKCV